MKNNIDIPTTCISDAMQGLTNMNNKIKPLKENYKLTGKAFTVKMKEGDNLVVLKAIREASPVDVLVIDTNEHIHHAIAGDFMIGMAKTLGIKGIVTNGSIRDIEGTKDLNFPVFCSGYTIAASGKYGEGELNVPISCGGITVNPGDIVVGDADGVTVIPKNLEEKVIEESLEKLEKDDKRDKNISSDKEKILKYLNDKINQSQ